MPAIDPVDGVEALDEPRRTISGGSGAPINPQSRAERIKLLATCLNTIGAGFAVAGVIGPTATYLYGTTSRTARPAWLLCAEVASLIGFSVTLHLLARTVLGRLDS